MAPASTQAVRDLDADFRCLFDRSPEMLAILSEEGMIECANAAWNPILGFEPADLTGQPLSVLLHPDDRPRLLATLRSGSGFFDARCQSGGKEWRRCHWSITRFGQGFYAAGRDFTAVISETRELQNANNILTAVLDASPFAIWAIDLTGNVQFWNPAAERIFGWNEQEAVHKWPPFLQEGEFADYRAHLERYASGETLQGLESRRHRKDGTPIDIKIWTAPLRDSSGCIRGTLGLIEDVTAERRAQERRRQEHRMEALGRLAGGVAHDFSSLLTVIRGYAELIQPQVENKPSARAQLLELLKAASRASSLVSELFTFSRRRQVEFQVFSLNDVVNSAREIVAPLLGEKIELIVRTDADAGQIVANHIQVEQILVNLASNARDAMPEGGRLEIETGCVHVAENSGDTPPGYYALLAVSDTGLGIDEETQQHIFDPFFTTKKRGGTGLGLATVYAILQQNGGHISVQSAAGQGSTFRVYFPRRGESGVNTGPGANDLAAQAAHTRAGGS
ncbi:MAG: PAS domain S-box protein [Bryobacteraceae bacterium]